MKNLANSYIRYTDHLEQINRMAASQPIELIRLIEHSYRKSVELIAGEIAQNVQSCRAVMIAGPSSSGKTTTSKILHEMLLDRGVHAVSVEMDRFYLGEGQAPMMENGKFDYESIHALNLPKMISCLKELMLTGKSLMPLFDFNARLPTKTKALVELKENEIAIIEGIHALNPIITDHLPQEALIKIYISVKQGIEGENGNILTARDLRLIRRLVRDYNFRNCVPERTISMWEDICRGEDVHIDPYKRLSDYTVNSVHIYEPCVFCHTGIPLLNMVKEDGPYFDMAQRLVEGLRSFVPIDAQLVPKNSLLREFYGGGSYSY